MPASGLIGEEKHAARPAQAGEGHSIWRILWSGRPEAAVSENVDAAVDEVDVLRIEEGGSQWSVRCLG
jgi:hypothetical protein